jgi:hypothetical protein
LTQVLADADGDAARSAHGGFCPGERFVVGPRWRPCPVLCLSDVVSCA